VEVHSEFIKGNNSKLIEHPKKTQEECTQRQRRSTVPKGASGVAVLTRGSANIKSPARKELTRLAWQCSQEAVLQCSQEAVPITLGSAHKRQCYAGGHN